MFAAAIAFGVVIGAALGLLGGGGSVLTVPIFVYVLGFAPKQAVAMSLAVVGVTSAFGAVAHWRRGNVNLRVALAFGAVAMLGTAFGVRLSRFVPGTVQLVLFGAVMLAAAVFMFRGSIRVRADGEVTPPTLTPDAPLPGAPGRAAVALWTAVPAGVAVGALTGLVGVGGGFLIVPALVLMRAPVREAIGTSLLVISANCAIGFLGYLGHVPMEWRPVAMLSASTLPGLMLGAYVHRFVPQPALRRGFAALLIVIGVFMLAETLWPVAAMPGR